MFDIIIIGAGVIGCAAARDLSRYRLRIALIEKEPEVAMGTSKANSGVVHAGYDAEPGTLKAKLNIAGNAMFEALSQDLDFPFKRIGSLVVAFSEAEKKVLEKLLEKGWKNGVANMALIQQEELRAFEPHISEEAVAALYAPTAGITCPYEMTIALAENAAQNGVIFYTGEEVEKIEKQGDGFVLYTDKGQYRTRYIINAAGLYADEISKMAGDEKPYAVTPRKGEYCLLDRSVEAMVRHVLFQAPGPLGKGVLVSPTADGNIIIGPTAKDIEDKNCTACTAEGLREVLEKARKTMPGLPHHQIITCFAGLRAFIGSGDFVVENSSKVKGLVNVLGIESPGLTSAPAIALMVVDLLREAGCLMAEKEDFNPIRPPKMRFRHMTDEERQKAILENPAYGNIICRCERVTEGEILEAIRSPVGARTLDGIKRRTRSGMGRCQGGFCSSKIVEILAKELQIPLTQVTKAGEGSEILIGENGRI